MIFVFLLVCLFCFSLVLKGKFFKSLTISLAVPVYDSFTADGSSTCNRLTLKEYSMTFRLVVTPASCLFGRGWFHFPAVLKMRGTNESEPIWDCSESPSLKLDLVRILRWFSEATMDAVRCWSSAGKGTLPESTEINGLLCHSKIPSELVAKTVSPPNLVS